MKFLGVFAYLFLCQKFGCKLAAMKRTALFTILFLIFLRCFVLVPVRVVSTSMMPSLHEGDIVLVNKFSYGSGWHKFPKIRQFFRHNFRAGDMVLARFHAQGHKIFIKRIIGLPGDHLTLRGHSLSINQMPVSVSPTGRKYSFSIAGRCHELQVMREHLWGRDHLILWDMARETKGQRQTTYSVPAQSYFIMGDNRDYSLDSRKWGAVPQEEILGQPFFILFSWNRENGSISMERTGFIQ